MAAAEAFIRFLRADSASDARRHWAITAEEKWSGLIGLHTWQHHHRRAELGCDMAVTRWGQGIAGNHRSVRLLERLGFVAKARCASTQWRMT
ncbi:MAG: GNAT family protein [Streptosporangiaceae bacterium]